MSASPARGSLPYLAMALTSCAILLYEIAITRLLSVVVWYHFAFLVISLAMLGLGVPGVWFSLRPPRPHTAWKLLGLAGVAMPVSIVLIVKGWARIVAMGRTAEGGWISLQPQLPLLKICLILGSVLVPLTLLGGAVCLFLMAATGRSVASMYASDLAGAAAGAVLVVPLLHRVPTPTLLAACGLLPLAAALLIRRERRNVVLLIATLLVASLVWGAPFTLRYNKTYEESGAGLLFERWTPTARLTVFRDPFFVPQPELAFGWGMGSAFPGTEVEQRWVEQDGSAGTPITRLSGAPGELDHLLYDVTSVGFQLRPARSACIIGAGGGRDILAAVRSGAERIDAVELNPDMISLVSDEFGEFSGRPYDLPGVRAYAQEGRSFLTHSKESYDLLQISLIDSWAATSAGAYALSENYLYTTEAVHLYWDRLSERGIASVSRWMVGGMRMEVVRLAILIRETLEQIGVEEPLAHLAIVRGGFVATVLFSRTPFSAEEIARLGDVTAQRGFEVLWPLPEGIGGEELPVQHVLRNGPAALEAYGFHLDAPTDERPFFFLNVRAFGKIPPGIGTFSHNEAAALLPRYLILILGTLALALFFVPFLCTRSLQRGPGFWQGSAYFAAIGLGFMFVETPLIQRFVLYLGHPSYATTVVLGAILLGSGLGSLAAGRLNGARLARLRLLVPGAVVAAALALRPAFEATLGSPFPTRVAISLALLLPLGFVLGFPFSLGMIRFGGQRAWLWAMNGAASVLASASAVTLATYVSLGGVVWIGAACYLAACLAFPSERAGR